MSFSIDNNGSEVSLSWVIGVLKYDFISFNLEKKLSAPAIVIRMVSIIIYDRAALGNGFWIKSIKIISSIF